MANGEYATKPFWKSVEFWTIIVGGLILPLLAYFGYNINASDIVIAEWIVMIIVALERLFHTKTKLTLTNTQ